MYGWVWLVKVLRFGTSQLDFFLVGSSLLLLIFLRLNVDLNLLNWLFSVEAETEIDQSLERRREVTWVLNVEA